MNKLSIIGMLKPKTNNLNTFSDNRLTKTVFESMEFSHAFAFCDYCFVQFVVSVHGLVVDCDKK